MIIHLIIFVIFFQFSIFSMDEDLRPSRQKNFNIPTNVKKLPELPPSVWLEISKFTIDRKAPTEKEVFEKLDNLRLTNKEIYKQSNIFIKSFCKEYNIKEKECSYSKFKLIIMDQIVNERVDKQDLPAPFNTQESLKKGASFINPSHVFRGQTDIYIQKFIWVAKRITVAANMKAEIWFKSIGKQHAYDSISNFGVIMGFMLHEIIINNYKNYDLIEGFLSLRPQDYNEISISSIRGWPVKYKDIKLLELFIKYGLSKRHALESAKKMLDNEIGFIGTYIKTPKETEYTKRLKEIIKELES